MNLSTATPPQIDQAIAEIEQRRYAVLDKVDDKKRVLRSHQALLNPQASVIDQINTEISEIKAQASTIREELTPYDEEFTRRGGWTRYFHVEHLHTSAYCPSFRPTTRIGWMPDYSGWETVDMIAAAGDMVCTKCVPDAPVAGKRPTIPELAAEWDKAHADDTCPGSGTTDWVNGKVRTGYISGNGGRCTHCDNSVSNTSRHSRVIRKHKA